MPGAARELPHDPGVVRMGRPVRRGEMLDRPDGEEVEQAEEKVEAVFSENPPT